jgi:hypothetical protein
MMMVMIAVTLLASSCGIFKKGCGCPPIGNFKTR